MTFGSWDRNLLEPNDTLNMIKTVSADKWSVRLGDFQFMNKKMPVLDDEKATIVFDPSIPWIQIPEKEWDHWY